MKFGKMELVLSVPKNIDDLLVDENAVASSESITGAILGNTQMRRARVLRQRLLDIVFKSYKNFRANRGQRADDIFETKMWPQEFDFDDEEVVPAIQLAQLKEQPVIQQKTSSIDNFINSIDKR